MNKSNFFLSDKPPNRQLLRLMPRILRGVEYLGFAALPLAAFLTNLTFNMFILLLAWCSSFLFYIIWRKWLKRDKHKLMLEGYVWAHGLLGVLVVAGVYLSFRWSGYGARGADPVNLWLMALVPLALVSRYGSTRHWAWLFILAASLYVVFRIGSIAVFDDGSYREMVFSVPFIVTFFTEGLILAIASVGIHFAFRLHRLEKLQRRVVTRVAQELASELNPLSGVTRAAEAIHKMESFPEKFYPYVHILLFDEMERKLKVVGGAGVDQRYWSQIRISKGEGVTGRSFGEKRPINSGFVKQLLSKDYLKMPGYGDVLSELAVPISYQRKVLGVLDVQSANKNEFNHIDEEFLTTLASGMGVALGNSVYIHRKLTGALEMEQAVLDAGEIELESWPANWRRILRKWFTRVAQEGVKALGADYVFMFLLSPGTYYPHKPPLFHPRPDPLPENEIWPIPDRSILWELIEDWIPDYNLEVPDPDEGEDDPESWIRPHLTDEKITSIVFLPVGLEERKAALFLFYKETAQFGDIDRLALRMYATAIERSLRLLSPALWRRGQLQSDLHGILTSSRIDFLGNINQIRENLDNPESLLEISATLENKVSELHENMNLAFMGLANPYMPHVDKLSNAINDIASNLNFDRKNQIAFVIHIDDQVEEQNVDLLEMLYRVASEAINNAIKHGSATTIWVRLKVENCLLRLEVEDNGCGLQPDRPLNEPFGIYSLRRYIQAEYGVRMIIAKRPQGGTKVWLHLPLRPFPDW